MATVFLYEFVTGGGTWASSPMNMPTGSLLREGWAMISALAADFLRIPDTEVVLLRDARLHGLSWPASRSFPIQGQHEEWEAIRQMARLADWTLLIAPECEHALLDRCRAVEAAGGRLLSPRSELVALASDKQRCAEHLIRAGIPAPFGLPWLPTQPLPVDFPYPAVLKPCDGAGSLGVQWIANERAGYDVRELGPVARLERYCPGLAVSVAVLCGPRDKRVLPACRQRLTDDGRFQYLGGETPLPDPEAQRAQRLALAAVESLPAAVGYVGVDLVLGGDPSGREDVVVEINPRLTTSYVGLRRLATSNLAAAMWAVAAGQPAALAFSPGPVQFDVDGEILVGRARA